MKKLIAECALAFIVGHIFLTQTAIAQTWQWVKPGLTNSGVYSESSIGITVDEEGCVYTTGSYNYQTGPSSNNINITLYKYAPNGVPLYKKTKDNNSGNDIFEEGSDVAVSLALNKVVVGGEEFSKPFLGFFDPAFGTFLYKSNFSGSGTIKNVDIRGNAVWVIGNFFGTFSPGGTTIFNGSAFGQGNIFIAKYNLAGALLDAVHVKGNGGLVGYDIKVDASNNVYFTATTQNQAQFLDANSSTYTPSSGQWEIFATKLNPSLDVLWTQKLETAPFGFNFTDMFPIALGNVPNPSDPEPNPVFMVGGLKGNLQESFFQVRSRGNAALYCQIATLPGKEIRDLSVAQFGYTTFITGRTAGVPTPTVFLSKINQSDCSNIYDQISNNRSSGEGVAMDMACNPVITGQYGNNVANFAIGTSPILTHSTHSFGIFTGLLDDPNVCCQNRGLFFDGINDYLYLNAIPLGGNVNFTIEAWVHSFGAANTCPNNFRRLIAWGSGISSGLEIGECQGFIQVKYIPLGISVMTTSPSVRSQWRHVAVTRNGTNMTVYVDGILVPQTQTGGIPTMNLNSHINIGRLFGNSTNGVENWRGFIDEVRLWNSAKSQADILQKMNCSLTGNELGLVLYLPLDQGSPNGQNAGIKKAYDYSPNNNHATLYNFTLSGILSNWRCSTAPITSTCPPLQAGVEEREIAMESEDDSLPMKNVVGISIFPNPTSGSLFLRFSTRDIQYRSYEVINVAGKIMQYGNISPGSGQHEFSIEAMPAGLYFVKVFHEGKTAWVEKIVKQ